MKSGELYAVGNIIKQKKQPSDLFLQIFGDKKIAKCKDSKWAKELAEAWNKNNL
jgi:hypothetical protein